MKNLWTLDDQMLPESLKDYIVAGPALEIPDPYRIFYIRMDWYKYVIGKVLLQAYGSAKARTSKSQEKARGKCEFEKYLKGMHLQPIYFISI